MIEKRLAGEVKLTDATVKVEVMAGISPTMNGGDLCKQCLGVALVELLKDKPLKRKRRK